MNDRKIKIPLSIKIDLFLLQIFKKKQFRKAIKDVKKELQKLLAVNSHLHTIKVYQQIYVNYSFVQTKEYQKDERMADKNFHYFEGKKQAYEVCLDYYVKKEERETNKFVSQKDLTFCI